MANKLQKKKTTVQKVVKKQKAPTPTMADKAHKSGVTVAMPKGEFVAATGRRKTATARVRVYKEAGDFIVNGKVIGDYFKTVINAPAVYSQPFVAIDAQGKYAVSVKVDGSGPQAQLDAVIHGVSRALVKMNPEYRSLLKKKGLLTRDDRMKETRKIGTGGKARRTKQSPKR